MKRVRWVGLLLVTTFYGTGRLSGSELLDLSFNPTVATNAFIQDLQLTASNKILIAEAYHFIGGLSSATVRQLNVDGNTDPTFDASHLDLLRAYRLAVQPDGKILVSGSREEHVWTVFRLQPDGRLDETFKTPVVRFVSEMACAPNGTIYIAGDYHEVNGIRRIYLARLLSDGTLDESFAPDNGVHSSAEGGRVRLALQADGKLIMAGVFFSPVGKHYMVRYNEDGSDDGTFSEMSPVPTFCNGLQVLNDGKILHSWGWRHPDGKADAQIRRYFPNRALDESFKHDVRLEGSMGEFDVQQSGKILAMMGGGGGGGPIYAQKQLIRFFADGRRDPSFAPKIELQHNGVRHPASASEIKVQPDGNILLAGNFSFFNGHPREKLVRLMGDKSYLQTVEVTDDGIKLTWRIVDTTLEYKIERSIDLETWSEAGEAGEANDTIQLLSPKDLSHTFFRVMPRAPQATTQRRL